jgi:hypothetical protein
MLTSIQIKTYEADRTLLLSMRDRSNGGSIRLSEYDRQTLSHMIDLIDEKLNGHDIKVRDHNGGR